MSFKVEVNTYSDSPDAWTPNGLRFETVEQAKAYGEDLAWRWILVRAWRVVESDEPVNRPLTVAIEGHRG